MPLIIPIRFSKDEELKLSKIMKQYPNITRTALIKSRLFNHRSRGALKMNTVDLIFLSTIKNAISCLRSDSRMGHDINPHLEYLERLVQDRLAESSQNIQDENSQL